MKAHIGSHKARTRVQIQAVNKTRKVNDELLMASEIVKHQENAHVQLFDQFLSVSYRKAQGLMKVGHLIEFKRVTRRERSTMDCLWHRR